MIYKVYAINDLKSTYLAPVLAASDAEAVRNFKTAYKRGGTALSDFPEDFRLCRIGTYDDAVGKLTACEMEVVFDGKELDK